MQITHYLTVNWHFTAACNFKCRYCFVHDSFSLKRKDYIVVLEKLLGFFKRINFVGGEPTVSPLLKPLVYKAYHAGFDCSIVTNGFNLIHYARQFKDIYPLLSCIGISVDSLHERTNTAIGRCCNNRVITRTEYEQLCAVIKSHGIRLKINTVVSKLNFHEDFTHFYETVHPDRIKLFQVLKPNTQLKNNYDDLLITQADFNSFVLRHKAADSFGKNIVAEDNDAITNAYYILDSECRFIDNKTGKKSPSLSKDGMTVERALSYIEVDAAKYQARYSA